MSMDLMKSDIPFFISARHIIKVLDPDIVQVDNLPFFAGAEFEPSFPPQIKVMQVIHDFAKMNAGEIDAFWAAINLADEKNLKKLLTFFFVM